MYNILISGNENEWNGKPFLLETLRCVREYTDSDITKHYGELNKDQIRKIKTFPCLFAYENHIQKNPKLGVINNITRRDKMVRIEYEIINTNKFITHEDMCNMMFELDIAKFEINRTHWAIKEVNLEKELTMKGFNLPDLAISRQNIVDITNHKFDCALSFPGEIRNYIESIAKELERKIGPNKYFYDDNYKAQLARPSLDTLLQEIYTERTKLIVVFLCEAYQEKEWCGVEFRAIKEIIKKQEHNRIMFVKMDDGIVNGVFETDGYINGKTHTTEEIASFICERISIL